jgi:two-component system LytT family response regulator
MSETSEIFTEDMNRKMEKALLEAYGKISYETKKIPLSTNDGIWMVKVKDIIRMEGEGNYSKIFFTNGETLLISKTLKDYESALNDYKFERIHKSHLVNLNHIVRYYKNEGSYVLMEDGTEIVVARNKREKLMVRLELL